MATSLILIQIKFELGVVEDVTWYGNPFTDGQVLIVSITNVGWSSAKGKRSTLYVIIFVRFVLLQSMAILSLGNGEISKHIFTTRRYILLY